MRVVKSMAIGVTIVTASLVLITLLIVVAMPMAMPFKTVVPKVEIVGDMDLLKGDVELCKQYREWQALPEIKGATTSMDTICNRLGY